MPPDEMECALVEMLRESDSMRGSTRREIERRNHVPVGVVQELLLLPDNVELENAELTLRSGDNFAIKEATKEEEEEKLDTVHPSEPPEQPE